jgi:hypothetical protein
MTRPALRALEQAYGRAVGALTMLDLLRGQALSEAVRPSAERLKPNAAKAFPDLAAIDVSGVNRDTFEAWKHEHPDLFTTGREIKPLGDFTRPPLDGLDQSKTIIVERRR